jgi:hypothetical protein
MAKLIILSVLIVSIAVPASMSTSAHPRKALRRMQGIVVTFVIVWGFLCLHWYPALVPLK